MIVVLCAQRAVRATWHVADMPYKPPPPVDEMVQRALIAASEPEELESDDWVDEEGRVPDWLQAAFDACGTGNVRVLSDAQKKLLRDAALHARFVARAFSIAAPLANVIAWARNATDLLDEFETIPPEHVERWKLFRDAVLSCSRVVLTMRNDLREMTAGQPLAAKANATHSLYLDLATSKAEMVEELKLLLDRVEPITETRATERRDTDIFHAAFLAFIEANDPDDSERLLQIVHGIPVNAEKGGARERVARHRRSAASYRSLVDEREAQDREWQRAMARVMARHVTVPFCESVREPSTL